MDQNKIELIVNLIYPHLKTKHKDVLARRLAEEILTLLDTDPPNWYTHG